MSSRLRRFAITLLFGVVVAAGLQAAETTELRFKFEKGQKTDYRLEQTNEISVSGDAVGSIKTSQQMTLDTTVEVKDVTEGSAKMTQTVTRSRLNFELPFGPVSYDSQKDEELPQNPLGNLMRVFKLMVAQPFEFTMSARGERTDFVVPEEVKETLAAPGAAAGFSEEALKQMMSAPRLPEKPVKRGDTWTETRKLAVPGGALHLHMTMTYKGPFSPKDSDRKFERIDLEFVTSFQKSGDAPVEIKIISQDAEGYVLFDAAAGRLVRSEATQSLQMEMKVPNSDMPVSQSIKSSSKIVLQP